MRAVVGVDSSTQSCKVVVVNAESGEVVRQASVAHPEGTAVDPHAWTAALRQAWDDAGVENVDELLGVSVGGQQHGMVALDHDGEPVFDALLWNDTRSAAQAERMVAERGVPFWVATVGSAPVASLTLTKLAWLREAEPAVAARVASVGLPHDFLNLQLTGELFTDRSDASGTGYFDPASGTYLPELLEEYFGAVPQLSRVVAPGYAGGTLSASWSTRHAGTPVAAGAGDNAAAALGLGLERGDVAVSIGTSGTVFASTDRPVADATGAINGFADATGRFLPLLATLNAARVFTATAEMLGVDLAEFDRLASEGAPDADGLTMIPYLDGERSPNLPDATGALLGLTRAGMSPENLARAAVLGVLASLAEGLEKLKAQGVPVERVLLIGGGSKSRSVREASASMFGVPVAVPQPHEYVALGAARQAMWAATGELPNWRPALTEEMTPCGDWAAETLGRYRDARERLHPGS
ncbi:xylulokinase [Haematomicrobium sanguinis]|uniref:xylulokinase n=1 Tax=Haematomicrobium sanguinis TaxID=479106 RepID=UPI00047B9119|nr:xylulokinase [Haematomicrobium sanguinis]